MLCLEDSRRPTPDVEARKVSPQLDLDLAFTDGYFVLDFVRVNLLRADNAGLSRPVSGPHLMWCRNQDSALKPIADGKEEGPAAIIILGAT